MKALFADTFYFIALLSQRDAGHQAARRFAADNRLRIVTSEFVLVEVADALCLPHKRELVVRLFVLLEKEPRLTIVPANSELLSRARGLYAGRSDKAWSLTDCTSFVIMHDEGLDEALTGDSHFEQAGFRAPLRQTD